MKKDLLKILFSVGILTVFSLSSCKDSDDKEHNGSISPEGSVTGYKDINVSLSVIEDNVPTFDPANYVQETLSETDAARVDGINAFSLTLLKNIVKADLRTKQNTAVSPYSVEQALSILANGSDGETLCEILSALGTELNTYDLNTTNKVVSNLLSKSSEKTELNTLGAIWLENGFPVRRSFLKNSANFYDAESYALSFSSSKAGKTINSWCSDKTGGMISKAVDEGMSGPLCLTHVVYFKSEWQMPFDESLTEKDTFTNVDGKQSKVNMMQSDRGISMKYTRLDNAQVASLPFHDGFNMAILLPDDDVDIETFVEGINISRWKEIMKKQQLTSRIVYLPKFKTDARIELNSFVQRQGVTTMFTENADFSKMSPQHLEVNKMYQVASIDMDEKGAKAAAVTVVDFVTDNPDGNNQPEIFKVNRPFVYVIYHEATNAILFAGCISNL